MARESVYGALASLSLTVIYFLIVSLAQGFEHALQSFLSLWYLMLPLVLGFGFQIYLFFYLRAAASATVASGGVSTGSMAACCAHHIADVLPIAGLSGSLIFFSNYQPLFLLLGILSNAIGITYLLSLAQKHSIYPSFLSPVLRYSMKRGTSYLIMASPAALALAFLLLTFVPATSMAGLKPLTESQNGVSYDITPLSLEPNPAFSISINTHSGSLDLDLSNSSFLEDNEGNKYYPLRWEGSALGGHHSSGTLSFPPLRGKPKNIKLSLLTEPLLTFSWVVA